MTTNGSGALLAVLLNPPGSTPGNRTIRAVKRAGQVLGYDSVEFANLCSTATPTVVELNRLTEFDGWQQARPELAAALSAADGVLAGWGVAAMSGAGRRALQSQIDWFYRRALATGIDKVWTVGGEPRHPSRWHQYVADRHARTAGGTFEQRLKQVLVSVSISRELLAAHDSRRAPSAQ